ncbi:hypothetical protein [Nocardioides sp.]
MSTKLIQRRNAWRELSRQDKQQRLESMRSRHQRQVEFEMLRLQAVR